MDSDHLRVLARLMRLAREAEARRSGPTWTEVTMSARAKLLQAANAAGPLPEEFMRALERFATAPPPPEDGTPMPVAPATGAWLRRGSPVATEKDMNPRRWLLRKLAQMAEVAEGLESAQERPAARTLPRTCRGRQPAERSALDPADRGSGEALRQQTGNTPPERPRGIRHMNRLPESLSAGPSRLPVLSCRS